MRGWGQQAVSRKGTFCLAASLLTCLYCCCVSRRKRPRRDWLGVNENIPRFRMSADEALIQALQTYVSKLSNTGKVLCPCSSSGMELLKRTSGYDLKEEFNVAGQLCSSGTGFATLPAFKDHVQKVGWSADFDPGSSGEAHHALFTVMIGSHANKKQRVQEAPFAGDEVSVPIMLMLEINPKAADPATYMSKNRLKEKFSDFPPSLYVPLYGSKATFMNKVVLVFEATADRSRSLAQCYRMATVNPAPTRSTASLSPTHLILGPTLSGHASADTWFVCHLHRCHPATRAEGVPYPQSRRNWRALLHPHPVSPASHAALRGRCLPLLA